MHTVSEAGHTGDVVAAAAAVEHALVAMDGWGGGRGISRADFEAGHPRLDLAQVVTAEDVAAAAAEIEAAKEAKKKKRGKGGARGSDDEEAEAE